MALKLNLSKVGKVLVTTNVEADESRLIYIGYRQIISTQRDIHIAFLPPANDRAKPKTN